VIGTADDAGSVVNTLDYDGFGLARGADVESVSTAGDFRFQGMWKDPTGLYYVRARTYEAETGRFTSRDPARGSVWSPATMNPYAFADSSPSRRRDPTGAFSIAEQSATLASINALVNISLSAPTELKRYAQGSITGVELATRLTSEFSRGVIEGYASGLGGGFWQIVFRDLVVGAAGELVRQLAQHETVSLTDVNAGSMAWSAIFNAGAGAMVGIVSARLGSLATEIQAPIMQLQLELRRVTDPGTALQLALEQGAALHTTRDILSAAEEASSELIEDQMRERSGRWWE